MMTRPNAKERPGLPQRPNCEPGLSKSLPTKVCRPTGKEVIVLSAYMTLPSRVEPTHQILQTRAGLVGCHLSGRRINLLDLHDESRALTRAEGPEDPASCARET